MSRMETRQLTLADSAAVCLSGIKALRLSYNGNNRENYLHITYGVWTGELDRQKLRYYCIFFGSGHWANDKNLTEIK